MDGDTAQPQPAPPPADPREPTDQAMQPDQPALVQSADGDGPHFFSDRDGAEGLPQDQGQAAPPAPAQASSVAPVSWTVTSAVTPHSKSWFMGMIVVVVILAAIAYLLTRSLFSSGAIIIVGTLVGYVYTRSPHDLQYELDNQGVGIGLKQYGYEQFRAFSLIKGGSVPGIALMPLHRFSPMVMLYYTQEVEQHVIETLSAHLPFVEYKPDAIDRLTDRLHF